jgi:hypothetical protein
MKRFLLAALLLISNITGAQTAQFTPYVSKFSPGAYAVVGLEMQRRYDLNVNIVRQHVNLTAEMYYRAKLDTSVRRQIREMFNKEIDYLNRPNQNWADGELFSTHMKNLAVIRSTIEEWDGK